MANYIQKITITKIEFTLPLPSCLASQLCTTMLSADGLRKLCGTSSLGIDGHLERPKGSLLALRTGWFPRRQPFWEEPSLSSTCTCSRMGPGSEQSRWRSPDLKFSGWSLPLASISPLFSQSHLTCITQALWIRSWTQPRICPPETTMQQHKQMRIPQSLGGQCSTTTQCWRHKEEGRVQYFRCMQDAWEHGFCSASRT